MDLPGGALPTWTHGRRPRLRPRTPRSLVARAGFVGAAALLVGAAVAGCSSSKADGNGLGPGVPTLGTCHRLTTAMIFHPSDTTTPVPCSQPHTSVTIGVGRFAVADVTEQNASNGTLGSQALAGCTADWDRTVGGDESIRHTTIVSLATFLPTREQLSGGARWYRCDLVIGGEPQLPLQPLPRNVKGILDGTVPDSLQACRTAPSLNSGHEVPCSERHTLRAVGVAPLTGTTYPGDAALRAQSQRGCGTVVKAWLKGRLGGGIAFQWPDATSWRLLHDHNATCWTVTTD